MALTKKQLAYARKHLIPRDKKWGYTALAKRFGVRPDFLRQALYKNIYQSGRMARIARRSLLGDLGLTDLSELYALIDTDHWPDK